jgi:hypothetical protein
VHGELVVRAAHGAVADVHVERARFDGELSLVVVEAEVGRPQLERDCLRLPWLEGDPLESLELADRLQDARARLREDASPESAAGSPTTTTVTADALATLTAAPDPAAEVQEVSQPCA